VVNGVTSTLTQVYGAVYTTTAAPLLTLNNQVYTANRAGYYVLSPGTTLVPGGSPVTVSGTVISLVPQGTAAVIQGTTSFLQPRTTVVTLTRSPGTHGGGGDVGVLSSKGAGSTPQSTSTHNAAGTIRVSATLGMGGWIEGIFLLGVVSFGWLAVWL
jgi:hypothetical protein